MSNTKEWICQNIANGAEITNNVYEAIADFCVMWAIFEGTELHDVDVAVDELEQIAKRVSDKVQGTENNLRFWKERYITEGQINTKFGYLRFSHEPHKNLVSQVLLGIETDKEKTIHALLLIVYRLRNNLFHGAKDVTAIKHQISNLEQAADFLKKLLLASGRYIFLNLNR